MTSIQELPHYELPHSPNPNKVDMVAKMQQILSQCQSKLPVKKYHPQTNVLNDIDRTPMHLDDEACYVLSKQLEPPQISVGA